MRQELRYGRHATIEIDVPEGRIVDCIRADCRPLDDPSAAVAAALAAPLGFPPLSSATIPGDQVVITLENGIPQVAEVVAGVVHALLATGAEPEDITILRAAGDGQPRDDVRCGIPVEVRERLTLIEHDPADSDQLSYLASSQDGQAIHFHRAICDADIVLPVGRLTPQSAPGYLGVYGGLYPTFSDLPTQQRLRPRDAQGQAVANPAACHEANEAAWLLGVQFTIQIVPGPGDSVLHVLAGDASAVATQGSPLCEKAWRHYVPRRASLVIATIEGGPEQQTWENLGLALNSALQVVADEGAILLCADLRAAPQPALQRLPSDDHDPDADWYDEPSEDATAAAINASRESARLYLLSGLDGDTVEDIGLAYVAGQPEVERLASQHDSCIWIPDAHRAIATLNLDQG